MCDLEKLLADWCHGCVRKLMDRFDALETDALLG